MRKFSLIFVFFIASNLYAGDDLLRVRDLYYRAAFNNKVSDSLYTYLKTAPEITISLLNGYKGMSYMIKANHSWNPYNKLSFFIKGKEYLDRAIEKDPKNVELRFLRFCVQTNAPGFLAYSSDIASDKATIITGYNLIKDEDLKGRIKDYMKNSNSCSKIEKGLFY